MRKYVFIFALLTLALTACRAESNLILDIESDGSGTVGFEIGFDEEFRNLLEQSGTSPSDMLSDLPDMSGSDIVAIERTDGDMSYVGAQFPVDDLSAIDLTKDGLDFFAEFFSDFSFTFDDDSATLAATVKAADLGGSSEDLPFDTSSLTEDIFSANIVVSMPGNVVQHNADEVRGNGTLVWTIPLSGSTTISATSELGGSSGSSIVWILAAVLLIGIIAAVAATIVSRNKKSETAVAAAAALGSSDAEATPESGEVADESTLNETADDPDLAPSVDDSPDRLDTDEPPTEAPESDQPEST